jgi:hypothetical protein
MCLFIILFILFSAGFSQEVYIQADSVDLKVQWTANTEEDLAGYEIYLGNSSRVYPDTIVVGKDATEIAIGRTILPCFVAMAAFDYSGNISDLSKEAVYPTSGDSGEGDLNGDGFVGLLDLALIMTAEGLSEKYSVEKDIYPPGGDGIINLLDRAKIKILMGISYE